MERKYLPVVLTVEAAAVFGVVLLILGGLILFCFEIHDRTAAKNALTYSIEVFSHRDPDSAHAEDYRKIAGNTGVYITGGHEAVNLKEGISEGTISGSVTAEGKTWTKNNRHLHAQRWLRVSALADFQKLPEDMRKDSVPKEFADP